MRGRAPKAEKLKRLQGNTRQRGKKKPPEVFFPSHAPSDPWLPPAWLPEGAKRAWASQIDLVRRETKLQESGLPTFAAYCDALARFVEYTKAIESGGATYTTNTGFRRAVPEIALRDRALLDLRNLAAELNLTPKSWITSMGTFSGRQLDLFMHGGARPTAAPADPNQPAPNDRDSFFAPPPGVH